MQLARCLLWYGVVLSPTAQWCCRPAPRKDTQQSCKDAQRHGRIAYPPVSSSYSMLCFVGVRKSARERLVEDPLDGGC